MIMTIIIILRGAGELDQKRWFEKMKENAKQENVSLDLVDLIEAITYLVCQDRPVDPDDFHKIISTKGMASKMAQVCQSSYWTSLSNLYLK